MRGPSEDAATSSSFLLERNRNKAVNAGEHPGTDEGAASAWRASEAAAAAGAMADGPSSAESTVADMPRSAPAPKLHKQGGSMLYRVEPPRH